MYKISIIIPCYNQAQYLPEALNSVLRQKYTNWECIIINDGSSDNTHEVAQEWLKKDKRFKYIYKDNGGLSSARNAGLDLAIGNYIQFLDADDLLDINRFESLFNLVHEKKSSEKQILISTFKTLKLDSEVVEHPGYLKTECFNLKEILYKWDIEFTIPIHCGLFPSSYYSTFRFDENLKAKEDWVMWLSVFSNNPPVLFIDEGLVLYRENPNGLTKDLDLMRNNVDLAITKIKHVISIDEYCNFLQFIIYQKNEKIKKIEEQNAKFQNSLNYRILKNIQENQFGKFCLKYILKVIKK